MGPAYGTKKSARRLDCCAQNTLTCIKYSSNKQSTQGSATFIGRTSLEMSQHFIKIIFSWKKMCGVSQLNTDQNPLLPGLDRSGATWAGLGAPRGEAGGWAGLAPPRWDRVTGGGCPGGLHLDAQPPWGEWERRCTPQLRTFPWNLSLEPPLEGPRVVE